MQARVMEDVPVSDDSRVVYRGRDTAVSSLLSHNPHSSFPVALELLLFSSLAALLPLCSLPKLRYEAQRCYC